MIIKNSKIFTGCILTLSLSFITTVAMAAMQPAQIIGTKVNVRTLPDTSSRIVTKSSNSKVSIIDKSNDWYKISFNGKIGWVNNAYIKVQTIKGKVNANGVNFRQSASTSGKIINSLNKGANVEILNTQSGWHKVKAGSKIGYIADKFITHEGMAVKSSRSTTAVETRMEDIDITNSSISKKVIAYAKQFNGVPYVYGGNTPSGFDCSGFIGYVFKKFGIKLNRSAADMYSNGARVTKNALKAGDLLFFDASSRKAAGLIDHAGIYLGNGLFIHASSSNGEVKISRLSQYPGIYIGARRVI